jgi:hypothetical protein
LLQIQGSKSSDGLIEKKRGADEFLENCPALKLIFQANIICIFSDTTAHVA